MFAAARGREQTSISQAVCGQGLPPQNRAQLPLLLDKLLLTYYTICLLLGDRGRAAAFRSAKGSPSFRPLALRPSCPSWFNHLHTAADTKEHAEYKDENNSQKT
jgi:hypothetical protein